MLFTDGDWLTKDDLLDEDAKVEDIATSESIDIDTCITRAIDECGAVLLNELKQFSMFPTSNCITPAHMMAVMNTGLRNNATTRI